MRCVLVVVLRAIVTSHLDPQEGEAVEYTILADPTGRVKAERVTGPNGGFVQGAPRRTFESGFGGGFGGGGGGGGFGGGRGGFGGGRDSGFGGRG
jgi:uncharacterized membrane protein YgcG